jgi:1,4-dihydroxy-2-naphthoate octaprenyltransferase
LLYLLGLVGVLCAFFYSATTRALSSIVLGELVGFCVFGPLLTLGAYLLQTGHVDRAPLLYGLPLGLLAAATIHVNNMRDVESDAHAGKHTIASILCVVLLLGTYAIIAALGIPHGTPHLILITLWTLPLLLIAISGVLRTDTPAGLQLVMRQVLKLETIFAILLIVALAGWAALPLLSSLPSLPAHLLPF